MAINPDIHAVVKRTESVSWSCIDNEAILLNLDNGLYYTLNELGCEIWKLIDEKRTIKEISLEICKTYDVDQQQVEQDIYSLFQEMKQESLIVIVEGTYKDQAKL